MWTDKAKDEAETDEQATIRFTPHPISQHLPSHFKCASFLTTSSPHRLQLDVADAQKRDGVPVVADYKRNDNAIELLKVSYRSHFPAVSLLFPYNAHHAIITHQAETMHKMVETFEYDGEHFALRVHACANTDVLIDTA